MATYLNPFTLVSLFSLFALYSSVFHFSQRFTTAVPESCMLILLGLVLGAVVLIASKKQPYQLDPGLFFLFLLPTIVGGCWVFYAITALFRQPGCHFDVCCGRHVVECLLHWILSLWSQDGRGHR